METMKTKVNGVILIDAGFTSFENEERACVIINRIGFSRLLSGYTQKEVADYCCVSKNTISSIERGQFCPSSILLMKLSIFLQEDADYLFQIVRADMVGDEYV